MELLIDLWLPIAAAAVLVFIVSSILHVVLPIHRGDYTRLPGEDRVLEAMRKETVVPGAYMFPFAPSMKEMGTPEMMEKYTRGPVGTATILPNGPLAIGKNLFLWFIYSLLIGLFTAYVATLALSRGATYMSVFRVTGAVAILAYAVPQLEASIWKGQSWKTTGKFVFDGILYGLATAAAFAWLWPPAE